ncbi:MAG: enoyl-CoA hydratase/carnithine racemase [Hyphomicrobiaceae bacterium]
MGGLDSVLRILLYGREPYAARLEDLPMANIELTRHDQVFVLHMKQDENRYNPDFLKAVGEALDEVEAVDGPRALVTTGEGKFYSNGLDLEYISQLSQSEVLQFLCDVHGLFARVLAFPGYTVAAMNGHAFAGGAMLALAHDARVMRSDRGYFCLPEIDLGMPFTGGMSALIADRMSAAAVRATVLTGARLSAADAMQLGIVDGIAEESQVVGDALGRATALAGKNGATLRLIKEGFYRETLKLLRSDEGANLPRVP